MTIDGVWIGLVIAALAFTIAGVVMVLYFLYHPSDTDRILQYDSVRVATTTVLPGFPHLGNEASLDGVALQAEDRVLVRSQTLLNQNGIYTYDGFSLQRASDLSSLQQIDHGSRVYVMEGDTFGGRTFVLIKDQILTTARLDIRSLRAMWPREMWWKEMYTNKQQPAVEIEFTSEAEHALGIPTESGTSFLTWNKESHYVPQWGNVLQTEEISTSNFTTTSARISDNLEVDTVQEYTNGAGVTFTSTVHGITSAMIGLGNVENMLHNWVAVTDPAVTSDTDTGYQVGSQWLNLASNRLWICQDASAGAAVWLHSNWGHQSNERIKLLQASIDHNDLGYRDVTSTSWSLIGNLYFPGTDQLGFGLTTFNCSSNAWSDNTGNIRIFDPVSTLTVATFTTNSDNFGNVVSASGTNLPTSKRNLEVHARVVLGTYVRVSSVSMFIQ